MRKFFAKVVVMPGETILDPQGKTVKNSLNKLGFKNVEDVRIGKMIYITLNSESRKTAEREIEDMCRKLLANPVIEDFYFDLSEE